MLNENLLINSNLLKAIINTKVKKVLFVGSTAVYNEKLKYNISEDKIFFKQPHSSEYYYSLSKRIMLEQLLALKNFYKISYVYVVMNNLYGPKDNFNAKTGHVVPSLIHKCYIAKKKNKDFEIWGSPNDKRCFLYSDDASEALLMCMKQNNFEVINVGSKFEFKISEVVNLIKSQLNYKGKVKWVKSNLKVHKKAIKDLKSPATKYGSKVTKHIKKHPIKYAAGAAGAAGYGIYSSSKEMKPKLIKAFAQLPKSDPRYKSLKKAGYV